MQVLVIFVVLCTLLSLLGLGLTADRIIDPPTDQIVALGQSTPASFSCNYEGTGFWRVNGTLLHPHTSFEEELEDRGVTYSPAHHSTHSTLTLNVDVTTALNNNTNVTCDLPGIASESAFVIIAGPPLPPHPYVSIVNSTTVVVHWDKPFTWQNFSIQNYTVTVQNSTTGEVTVNTTIPVGDGETFIEWPLDSNMTGYMMTNNGLIAHDCHELQFSVTASNVVGQSKEGHVSGGFPTAPGPFNMTELWYEVTFDIQLNPKLKINFTFPLVCRFQRAYYEINLFRQYEENELVFTTGLQRYVAAGEEATDRHAKVSETMEGDLEANERYTAIIIVETVVGRRNVSIDFSTMYGEPQTTTTVTDQTTEPVSITTPNNTLGLDPKQPTSNGILFGAVTGGVLILLLLAILVVLLSIILLRRGTQKKKDLIQTTEASLAKACEKMEANPIYSSDSPIYDVIVDTPALRSLKREQSGSKSNAKMDDDAAGQYVELDVNVTSAGHGEKIKNGSMPSVESSKLAECYTNQQKEFKPGSVEDTYTVMNPAGTVRSCHDSNQHSYIAVNGGHGQLLGDHAGGMGGGRCASSNGNHGFENRYVTTIKN